MTPPTELSLDDLLATWQAWSRRNLFARSLAKAEAEGRTDHIDVLRRALDESAPVDPLTALAANHELSCLLSGWQWHAVRAAREGGATWAQIGEAQGRRTAEQARERFLDQIERAAQFAPEHNPDLAAYRAVLDDPPQASSPQASSPQASSPQAGLPPVPGPAASRLGEAPSRRAATPASRSGRRAGAR